MCGVGEQRHVVQIMGVRVCVCVCSVDLLILCGDVEGKV